MERKYYLAQPGGKSMETITTWRKMYKEATAAAYALGQELGASFVYRRGASISGFLFDRDPGRAWRPLKDQGKGLYMPNRATSIGKNIMKKVNAIKIPISSDFANLLGGGGFILSGNEIGYASFEIIGDAYIVGIPVEDNPYGDNSDPFIPPDTTPLKLSEYYAMKEAVEG